MKELVVGSRFYHKGKLVEVCVNTLGNCGECVFNAEKCKLVNCKAKTGMMREMLSIRRLRND